VKKYNVEIVKLTEEEREQDISTSKTANLRVDIFNVE
jgi:hypothetical protein